jgi:hypothetical protein
MLFFDLGEAAGSLSLAAKRVRVRHFIRGDTRGPGQVGPYDYLKYTYVVVHLRTEEAE